MIASFPNFKQSYNAVGIIIRKHRREEEISQLCLSVRIGCSESTIRNLERGRIAPERMAMAYRAALLKLYPDLKPYFMRQH
jgi:ribosome-binding protein aMBF1 (putative translation factor)